jgi:hypothetical protein
MLYPYLDEEYKNSEEYLMYDRYNKSKKSDTEYYDFIRLEL